MPPNPFQVAGPVFVAIGTFVFVTLLFLGMLSEWHRRASEGRGR
jgi:hypothetical protein